MASKIEVKQRSLCVVETILRAILLQEVNILQQRTVVLREKLREKKGLIGDFRYLEVWEGFPNCSTKNLNKEPSRLAFITALDPTEYWGMIRECVYLFLQTVKYRLPKKRNTPEWPWVKGLRTVSLKNPEDQTRDNCHWTIDKSKYTSVLQERHFSSSNTL